MPPPQYKPSFCHSHLFNRFVKIYIHPIYSMFPIVNLYNALKLYFCWFLTKFSYFTIYSKDTKWTTQKSQILYHRVPFSSHSYILIFL